MKIKILLILLFISTIALGQQKGIVYYGYIEALQTGNKIGSDYNAYMVFNKDQSFYVTAKDSLERVENINEQKTYTNEDGGGAIYNGMKSSPQGDQVVNNLKKSTMWSSFLYRKQIYVKEVTPKMNWKIEKETKKIGKFICKKATTSFRGRNYTAWFTPEIPVSFGPWKLNGLPGIILEAYDTNKHVYWYFKTVEYPVNSKENVSYIRTRKAVKFLTLIEFANLREKEVTFAKEKNILLSQQYKDKGIIFLPPTLSEMFLEFE